MGMSKLRIHLVAMTTFIISVVTARLASGHECVNLCYIMCFYFRVLQVGCICSQERWGEDALSILYPQCSAAISWQVVEDGPTGTCNQWREGVMDRWLFFIVIRTVEGRIMKWIQGCFKSSAWLGLVIYLHLCKLLNPWSTVSCYIGEWLSHLFYFFQNILHNVRLFVFKHSQLFWMKHRGYVCCHKLTNQVTYQQPLACRLNQASCTDDYCFSWISLVLDKWDGDCN